VRAPRARGPLVTVPWLPPQHPLVDEPFALRAAAYELADTGGASAIRHGMQVRCMMVAAADAGFDGAAAKGEWHEGRCYSVSARKADKARGWPKSLYKAASVVWYQQDADTLEWYIDGAQTDNLQSPWRLRTQNMPFVKSENVAVFCDAPGEGAPRLGSPVEVVSYVRTLEPAGVFLKPVAASELAYHARVKTPIDLTTMLRRAKAGAYDEPASAAAAAAGAGAEAGAAAGAALKSGGMAALWDDMKASRRARGPSRNHDLAALTRFATHIPNAPITACAHPPPLPT
jgi:hypothetical protein